MLIARVALPRVALPRMALAHVALPRMALAHVTLPRMTLPRVALPRVARPGTSRVPSDCRRSASGSTDALGQGDGVEHEMDARRQLLRGGIDRPELAHDAEHPTPGG